MLIWYKAFIASLIINFILIVPVIYLTFTWRKHLRKTIDGVLLNPDYAEFTNDDLHLLGPAYLLWKDLIQSYIDE